MNPGDHATPQAPGNVVTIDAIFIAQQFERINVTLEFMKETAEKQSDKETAQDKIIDGLVKTVGDMRVDLTEVKGDVRAIKESKSPRVPTITWVVGAVAVAAAVLGILNQLYL